MRYYLTELAYYYDPAHPGFDYEPYCVVQERDGVLSLEVVCSGQEIEVRYCFQALDVLPTGVMSLAYLAAQPCINGFLPVAQYSESADHWQAALDKTIVETYDRLYSVLIEANGWTKDWEQDSDDEISDNRAMYSRAVCLRKNPTVVVLASQFAVSTNPSWQYLAGWDGDLGFYTPMAPMISSSADVSGIVTAIDRAASQDVDIALNSGAAIYSVRGRELTEPQP